jgi:hypothetical protein
MSARIVISAILLSMLGDGASAASLKALEGAWTLSGRSCRDTFVEAGSGYQFRLRSGPHRGVIVRGDRIIGANMTCRMSRVEQMEPNAYSVMLDCSPALAFPTISTVIKLLGETQFERFNPGFPDVRFTYDRCD